MSCRSGAVGDRRAGVMATFLTQAQLWPGVETAEVSIRQERVEVTALGDRERRFMAGPTTVEVSLRLGATAYNS